LRLIIFSSKFGTAKISEMRKTWFFLGLLGLFSSGWIQAQECPCAGRFDFFSEKIRLNYSGFRDKVTASNRAAYDEHTAKFRELAAAAASDTACLRVLADWKKWFRDGHVQIWQQAVPESPEAVRARFAAWEKIAMTEEQARAYLDRPDRDPVEGIWANDEGSYRVALTRQPTAGREFAASILKADSVFWLPGQVKFELKPLEGGAPGAFRVRFFMRDHSERVDTATLDGSVLKLKSLGAWRRQYPAADASAAGPTRRRPQVYRLERLDSATLLLVLPTMNEGVRNQLDSLMEANRPLLERTPNWVIDCRNNGGGSDITYRLVTPYLYTQRLWYDRMQVYATPDNAGKYDDLSKDENYPASVQKYGRKMARKIRRNEGAYIGKGGRVRGKSGKVLPNPQRVAVLINGQCASSCESFVQRIKAARSRSSARTPPALPTTATSIPWLSPAATSKWPIPPPAPPPSTPAAASMGKAFHRTCGSRIRGWTG
jgi:hypothetical protein